MNANQFSRFSVIPVLIAGFFMANLFTRAQMVPAENRKALFAGSWYDADSDKLKVQLNQFIAMADEKLGKQPFDTTFSDNKPIQGQILAAISPHAGYMFSGATAAFAYDASNQQSQQAKRKIKRIFLLGPSHYVGFHGIALPAEKTFATPLGSLKLDTKVVSELADFHLFKVLPDVHKREHSLELQLPFIKQTFGDVTIVPIIVGQLDDVSEIRLAAHMIKRYVEQDDLVIVSSDFTHYGPRYHYEPFKGHQTKDLARKIRDLDEDAFHALAKADLEAFIDFREKTDDTICGYYPCAVLLAMLPPGTEATLLNYRTSRDSNQEDDENSVSYMAIVFSNQKLKDNAWGTTTDSNRDVTEAHLSQSLKDKLLKLSRQTLSEFVQTGQVSALAPDLLAQSELTEHRGVFVTLYSSEADAQQVTRPNGKTLRGCIGYIWPIKPLGQAIVDNTIGAASKDPRFKPVTKAEIDHLQIDINVLTPLRRIASYKDIVLGRDGIVMYKNDRQAVFLPSVATEFGWTLDETLTQLSLKAGCGADGWRSNARFDVFQAESFEEKPGLTSEQP
jgi:AmmeMemoRadiSam system protein B/AmmeMemoRadiSam system protein A